jgi:hypothetical protein
MATTTATLTLSSTDLLSDSLSLSSTSTLYDAGTTTGVTQMKMGRNEIATGTNFDLLDATAAHANKANKFYIANKATNEAYYAIITIGAQVIGRLYAGDWMYMPWEAAADTQDIEIQTVGGSQVIEWVVFHEGETLGTAG